MISFEKNMILNAVTFDIKLLSERITKLTEEVGELAGAILLKNDPDIFEETVDNLMVIVSIYIDLGGKIEELELACTDAVLSAKDFKSENFKSNEIRFLEYSNKIGKFAESAQKYSKISTSAYKGFINKETILQELKFLAYDCTYFLGIQNSDFSVINNVISSKNHKWFKNALKGFMFNNSVKEVSSSLGYYSIIKTIKEFQHYYEGYNIVYIQVSPNIEVNEFLDRCIFPKILKDKTNYFFIQGSNNNLKIVLESALNDFGYTIIF
jgi:hypothetical protein